MTRERDASMLLAGKEGEELAPLNKRLSPCSPGVGQHGVHGVGKATSGDKNIMILAETFSKLRFLWLYLLFGPSIR
jgi:hypothetical protein